MKRNQKNVEEPPEPVEPTQTWTVLFEATITAHERVHPDDIRRAAERHARSFDTAYDVGGFDLIRFSQERVMSLGRQP